MRSLSAKTNTTESLKFKLKIAKIAVKDAEKEFLFMQKENKRRINSAKKGARLYKLEPGKSQAKKYLKDVLMRSKLRMIRPTIKIQTEKKNLSKIILKIKRFQAMGRCFKIL